VGIFAVKTTASQERTVADMIMNREEPSIHAALAPDSLTSYVMVEAEDDSVFDRILDEIPHARGVVQGQSSLSEVEHFLSPKPDVEGIAEGDIVELIAGPFKGFDVVLALGWRDAPRWPGCGISARHSTDRSSPSPSFHTGTPTTHGNRDGSGRENRSTST